MYSLLEKRTLPALTVAVPLLPPTVNHQYVQRADGGKALTPTARAFRLAMGYAVKVAARKDGWEYTAGMRLAVTISLTFSNERKTDIDNRAKSCLDAIAPVLGFDDRVIDDLRIIRVGIVKGRPLCEVEIVAIDAARKAALEAV